MIMKILCLVMVLILAIEAQNSPNSVSFTDFGMNKPHLLFHLGERKTISTNYGTGYWLNNRKSINQQYFTKSRLWYQNTDNGLYVNMVSHDGSRHIHQKIQDKTFNLQTNIKYQMLTEGWQQKISLKKSQVAKDLYADHSIYWFGYMSVENNDPELIDFKTYTTTTHFSIEEQGEKAMLVKISRSNGQNETISVQSENNLKVYGFTMNISQSYDVRNFMNEVKHILQIQRYGDVPRRNDSKLVQWQNSQVKLIKQNAWSTDRFVILVFYSEFLTSNEIIISNYTTVFKDDIFDAKSKHLNETLFPVESYPEHSEFLRHTLFNLYGGSAFYYGILYTQNSLLRHQIDYSFTFTPSRLIFPRGFLWDDGFHLTVALNYNHDVTLDIIHNWMRKIDLFGWIARQQIRGFEMSSLMPQIKFVYQDIFQMNPPTLIMPILSLIQQSKNSLLNKETKDRLDSLLQQNYWKLQKWYRYFVKTQSHNDLMQKEAVNRSIKYRWRCKDDCQKGNFMGSGLDDYPRTENQSQISKQHVDLMSWIHLFSQGLQEIANYLDLPKPQKYYRLKKEEIRKKIISECLDPNDLLFKDQVIAAKNKVINELVTRTGYITLFPFFTGVLRQELYEDNEREKIQMVRDKILDVMGDEKILFSQDGIRSLSISDQLYGTLDNYWRGAVWLPINFMVLRACKKYYWSDPKAKILYQKVRQNLIKTVKGNWQKTGYLFENYYQGAGNRGFPFYGWTSLMVNIITQQY